MYLFALLCVDFVALILGCLLFCFASSVVCGLEEEVLL